LSQKFHINSAGDVRVCNATLKPCRFGESDHFTDRSEARSEVEKRLSEDLGATSTLTKKKSSDSNSDRFASKIRQLTSKETPTPEELQEIGQAFEKEWTSRIGFNAFDHELTKEEILKVQDFNRDLFASIAQTGGDLLTKTYGPLTTQLNDAVKILPDNVKESIGDLPIFTKTISKGTRSRDGYHKMGNIELSVSAYETIQPDRIPEDAPDGTLIPSEKYKSLREISHPRSGTRVFVKKGNSTVVESQWIGVKPQSKGARKIADSAQIYIQGELVTIPSPVYALKDTQYMAGSEIGAKKAADPNEMSSVMLHEYCHAVQMRSKVLKDEEETMFYKLAGDKTFSHDYGEVIHKGFPNEYMAHSNGRELFTVASEGFFHPSTVDKGFLYGSDRGENADQVRQWITGLWISLSTRGNGLKKLK
jgi:hypothetical protein